MAADGMVSIRRPIRRANCWVKWRTSRGMSSRPLAQRRQHDREDVQAVVEVARGSGRRRPSAPGRGCVAATSRTSTLIVFVPPRRSNSCSCSTRSSFGCSSSGMSPTSSRNSVPWWASSKRPTFCAMAPVKAPFSWPNSSLSSRPVGMAAQLSLTKVRPRRRAQVVQGAGDQLLARAGLAADEHRGVGGGDGLDLLQHPRARALSPTISPKLCSCGSPPPGRAFPWPACP